jgi:hypothetical protein
MLECGVRMTVNNKWLSVVLFGAAGSLLCGIVMVYTIQSSPIGTVSLYTVQIETVGIFIFGIISMIGMAISTLKMAAEERKEANEILDWIKNRRRD